MNIIELAKKSGFTEQRSRPSDPLVRKGYALSGEFKGYFSTREQLERFVALVRAEALEEAAKACDGFSNPQGNASLMAEQCAALIRGLK